MTLPADIVLRWDQACQCKGKQERRNNEAQGLWEMKPNIAGKYLWSD